MSDTQPPEYSKEEIIIKAMKMVLMDVIRDTSVPQGHPHPLNETTIEGIRKCLVLMSEREQELAEAAGRPSQHRPRFTDEMPQNVVVDFKPKSDPE